MWTGAVTDRSALTPSLLSAPLAAFHPPQRQSSPHQSSSAGFKAQLVALRTRQVSCKKNTPRPDNTKAYSLASGCRGSSKRCGLSPWPPCWRWQMLPAVSVEGAPVLEQHHPGSAELINTLRVNQGFSPHDATFSSQPTRPRAPPACLIKHPQASGAPSWPVTLARPMPPSTPQPPASS